MDGLRVRPMAPRDADLRVRYFHDASDEHLEMMGVDRDKLPDAELWREQWYEELSRPIPQRSIDGVVWELDGRPIGFSTVDRIELGEEAFMHLHIVEPTERRSGYGSELVKRSARHYVERFELKRLWCEPNAFNTAPNRTLQRAGFSYVLTRVTTPGPLNTHQTTNLWVYEP